MLSCEPEVEIRVQNALERIERAQNELSAAAADLSGICGGISMWRKAGQLSDRCKTFWYALHHKDRRKWDMDAMHKHLEE